jgi:hypothetical protein
MSFNLPKSWLQTASLLGEIRLQLYYATVRSTQFVRNSTWRYIHQEDMTSNSRIRESFRNGLDFDQIPRERQDEYILTVQLGGEITSVDEVVFEGCRMDGEEVHLWLTLTKVESLDGEPFPVEAFILVPMNETIVARRKLAIEFRGFRRSFDGDLSPLANAPIEAIAIAFLKD